ncbi:hypothetical protein GCM10023093_23260 [Nemorincola caseinilytica]|uniref:Gliding motility-associated C-terminal domain-containing protein n=1 Tax=Nemorincola caseinilytica TaxID=2054315 RepID=A0ABP8NJG0_9BACT
MPFVATAQKAINVQEGMTSRERNYRTFSPQYKKVSEEALQKNTGYEQHPELGMLFAGAPAADCYEVLGSRTEMSKTFVKEGTNGTEILQQTSSHSMHYKDASGRWMTIKTQLQQVGKGIYAATEQPVPVTIDMQAGHTALGRADVDVIFNNGLELVYVAPDGRETSLGHADLGKHTAGDDGVYVTDVWPGVDMEVYVARGTAKTNFYIKHAMPAYAAGKLLVRDHWKTDGYAIYAPEKKGYKGNIEIRNSAGKAEYLVSAATAYEQNDVQHTLQMIGYDIDGNTVDIVLPGDYLNRGASAYPVVIDPLVTTATASAVGGSSYSPSNTVSCNYVNAATVPPNVTVTDVRWSFNYVASGGALLLNGAIDFMQGTCRSPSVAGFFWFCNLASAGTCTGTNVSIFSDIASCIPAPQCPSYPLNLTMRFYQNFATTAPCASTYISAGSPLTITVSGRTVETTPVTITSGANSICLGQSVTLSTTPSFGVPPYSYSWNPGATPGNPATLSPTTSTNYTVTVTDACGQTAEATQGVTVTPIAPINGTLIMCVGGTTTLSHPSGPGVWTSLDPSVAVIGPSTGVVTGIAAGTSLISFKTPAGCYATTIVTVLAMPGSITGVMDMCVGNSTTLSNPLPGGTWASSNLPVAVVGGGTGLVTGISPGTSMITYTTSPGCTATAVVTVYANPSIASVVQTNPTGCGATDGTISLLGLAPGVTYTVTYTFGATPVTVSLTADGSGTVVITGLSAGTYTGISVTSPQGCTGVTHGAITLTDIGAPPAPTPTSNSPICDGGTLTLSVTSVPGATFSWTGPAGFASVLANPIISPATAANAGVYTVTATASGCVSLPGMVTVVINPIPHINDIQFTDPVTCGGNEGTITLTGLVPGVTYNVAYVYNGVAVTVPIVADELGNVVIYGLKQGTYTGIFVESFTCVSNVTGPVTLTDPPPPPKPTISSNAPICVGLALQLYGADAKPGGTYEWKGPNGFASNEQNPIIPYVTTAAQGVYTLTYTHFNCKSSDTGSITLRPEIKLTGVKADKYDVPYGDSVQVHAEGATYYIWTPLNKGISDPYIANPFVKPVDEITKYTVRGMNEWGCRDSADVIIRVIFDEIEYIPNSFTPNNDGLNDIFRIGKMKFKKLVDFTIYNRWGQEVYHNAYDPAGGWDGTTGGTPQDIGVYYYSIIVESASGKLRYYKGDVTLLR